MSSEQKGSKDWENNSGSGMGNIPGSRMEVVPGAAHSAHFEQARIFNKLLAELLDQVCFKKEAGAVAD